MGNKSEVSALLCAITPYTLPEDPAGQLIFDQATDATLKVTTNLTPAELTRAQCYYVAHLLNCKGGGLGITSKHIGSVSVGYTMNTGTDPYYDAWDKLVSEGARSEITASLEAVVNNDITLANRINLDASGGYYE